jgi:hypothetical protein
MKGIRGVAVCNISPLQSKDDGESSVKKWSLKEDIQALGASPSPDVMIEKSKEFGLRSNLFYPCLFVCVRVCV